MGQNCSKAEIDEMIKKERSYVIDEFQRNMQEFQSLVRTLNAPKAIKEWNDEAIQKWESVTFNPAFPEGSYGNGNPMGS